MKWPFIGGNYAGRSKKANAQTCLNFFIEPASKGQDAMLVPTPGYTVLSTSTVGVADPVRGMLYPGSGNIIYVVQGASLVTYNTSSGVWTLLGAGMSTSTGPVSMAFNSAVPGTGQVLIAAGGQLWSWDIAAVLWINLTALYLFQPNTVVFLDGRFIVDDQTNSGRFYASDLYSQTFTNPFNFATVEGSPDYLRAIVADRRELWLFGDLTTEIWWNTGDANNPYQRSQGGFIHTGIAGPYTAQRFDNSVIWLSRNEHGELQVVRAADGYIPEVVSPPEINFQIAKFNSDGAYAMVYQLAGHEFYVLTFPENNRTYVLDALTKEWHVWRSGTQLEHVAQCITSIRSAGGNKIVMGTTLSDRTLYELSDTVYTDNGAIIRRERITTHVHNERQRVRLSRFQLDVEAGPAMTPVRSTTISTTAVVAGDTTLNVADATSVVSGQLITLAMTSGRIHTAFVTSATTVPTPDQIVIDTAVTEAAAVGAAVEVYPSDLVTLSYSKDGELFGGNVALHIGGPDTKRYRAIASKLGSARSWTFSVQTLTSARIAILGAYATLYGEDRNDPG